MSQSKNIYTRFFGIALPAILLAFTATIALFEWFEHSYQVDALKKKLDRLSSTYTLLYAEPVAKQDFHHIKSYSLALILDEDVAEVTLSDTNKKVIDYYHTGRAPDPMLSKTVSINYADEDGLRQVGWLTVVLSCDRIETMLADRLPWAVLLLVMLVVASMSAVALALYPSVHVSLKRLGEEAACDSLTSLLNRRSFYLRVKDLLSCPKTGNASSKLLFLDLDGFQLVNDQYGHRQGDLLLTKIARILQENVRTDDAVARLGGDEFAVLLKSCNQDKCLEIAESVRSGVEALKQEAKLDVATSVSIGVISVNPNLSFEEHLDAADKVCYQAKRSGKNRVCFENEFPRLCA